MPSEAVDILIVDDRLDGLIALESVLDLPMINVVKAQSGREAVAHAKDYDFALILLDVQMPEMDGFETAQQIRKEYRNKSTPIIFVTAINKDERYIYKGYEAGAVDYVFKPFEPQILRSKIAVFIDLFRKTRQLRRQTSMIRESEIRERYLRLAELEVESLKRYRNLADAIPHMLWRARADGTVDYFNRGWIEYTGLSLEASMGNGWQAAIEADDLSRLLKQWMESMQKGEAFHMEIRIRGGKGTRWHWLQVVPELSQAGTCLAWLGTCTDIHDRKITEQKLIAAEKAAKSANQSKTTFLANMSHEIRTPMNAILGFTELIRDPNQTVEARLECVETVQRNGQQLLRIIDEILDISKVEGGHLELEDVAVDMGSFFRDLKDLLYLQTDTKGLSLEFGISNPVPRSIYSDPTRLRQILINVIANAIKFTQKGGVRVDMAWASDSDPRRGCLSIRVQDTGVGIKRDQVERLFQPFMQGDNSTTRHFGGSGLGLALSREFARAMGGDVVLEHTRVGEGSCFRVDINTLVVEGAEMLETLDLRPIRTDSKWTVPNNRPLDQVKVLLVDDLEDNRDLLGRILTMAGAAVDFAENGQDGVDKAVAQEYDVVLMDIQMPLLDGYEATRRLRAQGFNRPIIALTAYALREERNRCLEAGCDDHLTKPIKLDVLINQVSKAVRRERPGGLYV